MLWLALGIMSLAAAIFAIWPFLKDNSRNFGVVAVAILVVVGSSAALYSRIGSPGLRTHSGGQQSDMTEVVEALAARLADAPDDLDGWRMLGRSYMTLGNYAGAVTAYEHVVDLESGQNAQGLVELGEALLAGSAQTMSPRVSSLFENALALEPNNPAALFWGGIGAVNRGDRELAADRWERLLGTNPPAEIRDALAQRIAEWRGERPPAVAATPAPAETSGAEAAIVSADIALSDAARQALPPDATVFVIARDPAQPSPPIAVTRRRLAELPATVRLSDRESMVPGRELSGFAEFELVARVSLSGQPVSQPGDWFGSVIVRPAESGAIRLSIDTPVQ